MPYAVWYMKPEWFTNGLRGALPSPHLTTHTWLRLVDVPEPCSTELKLHIEDMRKDPYWLTKRDLNHVFRLQQGENWSPNGEAMELLESKGLTHTSMCIGDVIVDPKQNIWLCEDKGWTRLKKIEYLERVTDN